MVRYKSNINIHSAPLPPPPLHHHHLHQAKMGNVFPARWLCAAMMSNPKQSQDVNVSPSFRRF